MHPSTIKKTCNTAPCQLLDKKPDITGGVVHGIIIPFVIGTKPILIVIYVIIIFIIGTNMKGINNNGFKTIGKPYITGSFIPNTAGSIDKLDNCFNLLDFDINTATINNDSVEPAPPNVANKF